MKNSISIFLSVIMIIGFVVVLSSCTKPNNDIQKNPSLLQDDISNVLKAIREDPSNEYTDKEIESMYIGQKFIIENLDGSPEESIFYYPMVSDAHIVGIISVALKKGSERNVSAGRNFSEQLDKTLQENSSGIVLFSDEASIKAINSNKEVYSVLNVPPKNKTNSDKKDYSSVFSEEKAISLKKLLERNSDLFIPKE